MNLEKLNEYVALSGFLLIFLGIPISKFLISVGVVLAVISAILKGCFHHNDINFRVLKTYTFLLLTFLFSCLSLIYTSDIEIGIRELIIQNGLFTIPIVCTIHWKLFKAKIHLFLNVLLYSATAAAIITWVFYMSSIPLSQSLVSHFSFLQDYPDVISKTQFGLYSPFIDRLHFAYILSFCFLVSLSYGFLGKAKFYWTISFILLITILTLGARGAQIALLFALIPFIVLCANKINPNVKLKSARIIVCVLIFLIVTPLLSYKLVPSVRHRFKQMIWEIQVIKDNEYRDFEYQYFTTLTRLKSLQNTWQVVKAHPLKGVGIGDLEPELRLVYEEKSADIPLHNQNYFLYIWASSGIISLLSFLFFIVYWTRYHYVQNKILEMKGLVVSYTIFIVLILMLDVVLKYHLGAVSIPLFLMSISALSFRKAEN